METTHDAGSAPALPLFVFLLWQFLQPRWKHEERVSFHVTDKRKAKNAPLVKPPDGNAFNKRGEERVT